MKNNIVIFDRNSIDSRGAKVIIQKKLSHETLFINQSIDTHSLSQLLNSDFQNLYLLGTSLSPQQFSMINKIPQNVLIFNIPETKDGTDSEETKNSVTKQVWEKFYGDLETPVTVNLIHDSTLQLNMLTPFSVYFKRCEPLLKDEVLRDLIFSDETNTKLDKWLKVGREVNDVFNERIKNVMSNKEFHLLGSVDDEPIVYLKGIDDEDLNHYLIELLGTIASMYRMTTFYVSKTNDEFSYIGVTPTGEHVKLPNSKEFIIKTKSQ